MKKLFLLDAMALIYRAYYAMIKSPRFTTTGLNTSAMLGFTNTLYEVIRNEKPTHIAVAFDTGAPTLRHADFEEYKANREATPDDIVTAIPYIQRIITAFGRESSSTAEVSSPEYSVLSIMSGFGGMPTARGL